MCDIISMTPSKAASRGRLPAGESAEILFFTGVRYYRMPDAVPEAPVRRRKAPRRPQPTPRLDCQA